MRDDMPSTAELAWENEGGRLRPSLRREPVRESATTRRVITSQAATGAAVGLTEPTRQG